MYNKILNFPKIVLLVIVTILLFSFYFSKNFKLDASAETLLLENDDDLTYLREINKRYGSEDFFILTYEPTKIIDKKSILQLENFVKKINKLDWVSKTISVVNTPLLNSSNEPLIEKLQNLKYITNSSIKIDEGLKELSNSPVFKNLIISADKKTFGIIVYLKNNNELSEHNLKKAQILAISKKRELSHSEKIELKKINLLIEEIKAKQGGLISNYNSTIKRLIKNEKQFATIHLSGIPMIADDMISFIKKDIIFFGIGVFLFIVLILWAIFKNIKWVLFPLVNCFISIFFMIGLLGFLDWKVTVISSNFIALMLILTISMNIHYLTRYLQIKKLNPDLSSKKIIEKTSFNIFYPIFYAVLTTIFAFISLVLSDIKPVIDFGWMMTFGIIFSFLLLFFLLPSLILIFEPKIINLVKIENSYVANTFANISIKFPYLIYFVTIFILIFSFIGIKKLKVENSFINYFSKTTEIYKGMKKIDENLGGTTPLEIIIKFKKNSQVKNDDFLGIDKKNDDDFLGENIESSYNNKYKYWFTKDKIDKIRNVHNYLEENPYIGKVLSFSSILDVAKNLNNGNELGSLEMGILYNKIPEEFRKNIITPYISVENDEARISTRILDSKKNLRRKELIEKINIDLQNKFALDKADFRLSGILIIYNNLLQSLFDSQIKTLGFVMLGIFLMLLVLFKSITYALIGTIPNFIAAFFILGFIGNLNIPLDMMTITIAAITIGIAVDNSIHYIYRYREELSSSKNKIKTVFDCHQSVGKAIISTSITIVFGFSILSFSNFIPTIYFGLFTGLAMITALFLVLTLLPVLLIQFSRVK